MLGLDRIFNFELLGNPVNWLMVYLMVAFMALAVTVLHAQTTQGS